MVDAGIVNSKSGKVRLLKPGELPHDWNPEADAGLTKWECVHQLVHALNEVGESGEAGTAALVGKLGARAEAAREPACSLYTICARRKRAADALAYNALVQSWPEIARLAQMRPVAAAQGSLI